MRFADIVGNARAVERLRRAIRIERVPSALLLFGPVGLGKRTLAEALASRLLCLEGGDDACGTCAHCSRVARGVHPDVRIVEREESRRDIRVEQVRELARWLSLQPLMATRKVAIVDGAHLLNEHGQNALLKTLEEPPGASVLVLTAPSAALGLPTVRSRCQLVRLDLLSTTEVEHALVARGLGTERAHQLAPLAEGCPGRVAVFDGDAETTVRETLLGVLPRLQDTSAADISKLAQELARGPVDVVLAVTLSFYRDVLERELLGDTHPLRNPDAAAVVQETVGRLTVPATLRQLEVVCDTLTAVEGNANRTLALETLLLALRATDRGHPIDAS